VCYITDISYKRTFYVGENAKKEQKSSEEKSIPFSSLLLYIKNKIWLFSLFSHFLPFPFPLTGLIAY